MFDNIAKFLIEQYSPDFASWLIGEPLVLTELKPAELSLEPIRADALILLQSEPIVLHCECQTDPDPSMPFRMADYALRVYRRFPNKRLVQVVIYLRQTNSERVYQTSFSANQLRHEFDVIRLWEQPTEVFLRSPGLLPFAVLSQTSDRPSVLQQVGEAIDGLTDRQQQSNLAAATGVLAGLVLDKQMIRRVLRRELMQESVIYQELREEARAEARQALRNEIRAEVQEEARAEVRQALRNEIRAEVRLEERSEEARSLILRQLVRRVGELPESVRSRIESLTIAQLEALGEALLDFANLADLEAWLGAQAG